MGSACDSERAPDEDKTRKSNMENMGSGRKLDADAHIPVVSDRAAAKPVSPGHQPEAIPNTEQAPPDESIDQAPLTLEGRLRCCPPAILEKLEKILENILSNPWNNKMRTLHGSNTHIRPILEDPACAEILIQRCGFASVDPSEDLNKPWFNPRQEAQATPTVIISGDGEIQPMKSEPVQPQEAAPDANQASSINNTTACSNDEPTAAAPEAPSAEGGSCDPQFVFSENCVLVLADSVELGNVQESKIAVSKALAVARSRKANANKSGAKKKAPNGKVVQRAQERAERDRIIERSKEQQAMLRSRNLQASKIVGKKGDSANFVRCEQIGINTPGQRGPGG